FGLDRAGIVDIAVTGARQIRELAGKMPETEIVYQYSPESFSGTELDFAIDICEALMDVWQTTRERKMIVSLHPHNVRGTAVAATEFGVMAGADRVEGTLFGNGKRTGNVDVITLAL